MVHTISLLVIAVFSLCSLNAEGLENKLLKSKAEAELIQKDLAADTSEPLATVRVELKPFAPKKPVTWGMDLGLSSHQLRGSKKLEFIESQDLAQSPEFEMVYFKLNRYRKLETYDRLKGWFLSGDVGFGRTTPEVKTESGFIIEDVRLQALRARLQSGIEWGLLDSSLALVPQVGVGILNLTQVSSNTAARFSESKQLLSGSLLLQWRMIEHGLIRLGYEQSQYSGDSKVEMNDNTWLVELGYRL